MYLEVYTSLIGIYALAMVVKEIIVREIYILLNPALVKGSQRMYLNI